MSLKITLDLHVNEFQINVEKKYFTLARFSYDDDDDKQYTHIHKQKTIKTKKNTEINT